MTATGMQEDNKMKLRKYTDRLLALLPEDDHQTVLDLDNLEQRDAKLRVAAVGKYNHGKSTLLNALADKTVFRCADVRQTTEVQEYTDNGITWIDTPGLDSDVFGQDDKKAKQGWKSADIVLLVHNVREGELDRREMDFLQYLADGQQNSARPVLVLTQVDQAEQEELIQVTKAVTDQIRQAGISPQTLQPMMTSSKFHEMARKNPSVANLSGIPKLRAIIDRDKKQLSVIRKRQFRILYDRLFDAMAKTRKHHLDAAGKLEQRCDTEMKKYRQAYSETRKLMKNIIKKA